MLTGLTFWLSPVLMLETKSYRSDLGFSVEIETGVAPAESRRWSNVSLMLAHRL